MRLTVRVPATSANLGPGFDCFGLALELCNEVTSTPTELQASLGKDTAPSELPTDGTDLIQETMRRAAADRPLPALQLRATNRVPLASGLGSSSAAVVAGVVGVPGSCWARNRRRSACSPWPPRSRDIPTTRLRRASAASRSRRRADSCVDSTRIPTCCPVVLVPERLRLPTADARALLGELVSRADAVVQRGARRAVVDAIVERTVTARRGDARPPAPGCASRARARACARCSTPSEPSGVPVCVSGSGPTLLAFPGPGDEVPSPGPGWRSMPLPVRSRGFELD